MKCELQSEQRVRAKRRHGQETAPNDCGSDCGCPGERAKSHPGKGLGFRACPEKEKNNLLVAAVSEPGERWKNRLLRRFEQQNERRTLSAPARHNLSAHCRRSSEIGLRPCGRKNPGTGGKASGGSCATAEDEANRSRYLDQLGKREEATWNQIAAHIQK